MTHLLSLLIDALLLNALCLLAGAALGAWVQGPEDSPFSEKS